ncbi:hypothetical protein T08_3275 [Trichinella sp. T8]|nr:hypothetical protein T08_3275 [Trichinella sp. T8]
MWMPVKTPSGQCCRSKESRAHRGWSRDAGPSLGYSPLPAILVW